MFGSLNVIKSSKQLMIFKPISRTFKDADSIKGTMRSKNVGVELFKMISHSDELVFSTISTNRGALVPEGLRTADVHAPLLSEHAGK
jgi:hypothetical protein